MEALARRADAILGIDGGASEPAGHDASDGGDGGRPPPGSSTG
jgi:hypothetical protein